MPAPKRQTVLSYAPLRKASALDWVERARLALDMASSLMRSTALAKAHEAATFDKVADEVRSGEGAGEGRGDRQQPRQA